jgi:hypothetical protein
MISIYNLFNYGFITLRSNTNNVYRFTINSFIGLIPIINYLNNYPLKTKKLLSYNKWLEIYEMVINKKHLTKEGLDKIKELSKLINKNNSLTKKIGSKL